MHKEKVSTKQKTLVRAGTRVILMVACLLASSLCKAQLDSAADDSARAKSNGILQKMTIEEKIDYLGGTGFAIRAIPRLGLPALEMSDGPYGVRSNEDLPSTAYAAGIGLAAAWNRDLAKAVGGGIGKDARARGIHFMLGPGVNIYRSPRNGRNFEYFGEDPYLASAMTVSYIDGMQGQGVSATIKHFLGNNSEFLRHDSDSIIEERALHEIYLPAFEKAVKQAHVGAIMDSYNLADGSHMTQNGYFNTELLRKQWNFDGVVMSDWDATYDALAAVKGGLDVEMPTGKFMNRDHLLLLLKSATISETEIDAKVRHILFTAERFGWFDRSQKNSSLPLLNPGNEAVALQSARESLVLLKNDGKLLPLDRGRVRSILVVGPDAYPAVPVGGGSAEVKPFHAVSVLEGISTLAGSAIEVRYVRGLKTISELALETNFVTDLQHGLPGLKLEIFQNLDLSGSPSVTSTIRYIHSNGVTWQSYRDNPTEALALFRPGPTHVLSRRWSGYYLAPHAGRYIVVLQGDGVGNRCFVDDKLVVDNWTLARALQPHLALELAAGMHKVVVESAQNSPVGGRLQFAVLDESKIVDPLTVTMAKQADIVVVAAGFDRDSEGEGSDRTFALPAGQDELIRAIAAANTKTVVCVTSGGNVDSEGWIRQVPAYLEMWYPGQEGGRALAEVLFGAVNPSGHLPATFERRLEDNPTTTHYYPQDASGKIVYAEGIFVGYRGYEHNHTKPLFPFGFGLSYTTFTFTNLQVSRPNAGGTHSFASVSFDVTNTGDRAGQAVAQIYVSETHPPVTRPEKELKGFEKILLQPGEKKRISLDLDPRSFAYYEEQESRWRIAPGRFELFVGDSSEDASLKSSIEITPQAARGAF